MSDAPVGNDASIIPHHSLHHKSIHVAQTPLVMPGSIGAEVAYFAHCLSPCMPDGLAWVQQSCGLLLCACWPPIALDSAIVPSRVLRMARQIFLRQICDRMGLIGCFATPQEHYTATDFDPSNRHASLANKKARRQEHAHANGAPSRIRL